MSQIVYQPEIDGDRPVLQQRLPTVFTYTTVDVQIINKATDALVATTTGVAVQSAVDSALWFYDTTDVSGINLETVDFAQLSVRFRANITGGGVIDRTQDLVVNGAAKGLSLTRYEGAVHVDTTGGGTPGTTFPIGTPQVPVSNLGDAITIAMLIGRSNLVLTGSVVFVGSMIGWGFQGSGGPQTATFDLGGQDVDEATFTSCTVTGIMTGTISGEECTLDGVDGIDGQFLDCGLLGTTKIASGGTLTMAKCFSKMPGSGTPVLDFVGANRTANIRSYSGGWDVRNMGDVTNVATIEYIAGQVIIDVSCTAGNLQIRGIVAVADNSNGTTVVRDAQLESKPLFFGEGGVFLDTVVGVPGTAYPTGTRGQPSSNITDALAIAVDLELNTIFLRGSITAVASLAGYSFKGRSGFLDLIDVNGQSCDECNFERIELTGAVGGVPLAFTATQCRFTNFDDLFGEFVECYLDSNVMTLAGDCHFEKCSSTVPGTATPKLFMAAATNLNVRGFNGGLEVRNVNGSELVSLDFVSGSAVLASSCTAGTIVVRGCAALTDNSTGATVIDDRVSDLVWEEAGIKTRTNNATLNELLGVADSAGVDLPEQVNTELETVQSHGAGAWTGTTPAAVAAQVWGEALPGAYGAGEAGKRLGDVDVRLPSDPADESLQQASHAQTQADIGALNNIDQAGVQAAMTAQGYTTVRAALLDNLDATISSVVAAIGLLNDLSIADIQTAMTTQGYTAVRAALLDNLDAAISTRSSHSAGDVDTTLTAAHGAGSWVGVAATIPAIVSAVFSELLPGAYGAGSAGFIIGTNLDATVSSVSSAISALNNLSQADVQTAMTAQGYTAVRAALIDNLDASVTSIASAISALNDLSQADVQTAMTSQGFTTVRAALIDNLDAAVSTVLDAANISKALVHDNAVVDNQQFNHSFEGNDFLTDARIRAYNSKANALAAGATGLLYTFTLSASYTSGVQTLFRIVRE